MTPSERLMQRLGANDGKTASRPSQEKQAAPSAQDTLRARMDVKKEPPQPSQGAPVNVKAASNVFATSVNTQALRDHTMGVGARASGAPPQAPRGPSAADPAGRPADRLTARLATPQPSQPSQGRPAPNAQRQQAQGPARPTERLNARLAAGGTEKVAAAIKQQQQRGPTPGRGM